MGNWTVGDDICDGVGESRIFADDFSGDDYFIIINSAILKSGYRYGVYFRATDPNAVDGYIFQYDQKHETGAFVFRKWLNGYEIWKPIAVAPAPPNYDWYNIDRQIQLNVIGDTFTLSIDGQEIMTVVDDTYSKGGIGFRTWSGETKACFSDISISNPKIIDTRERIVFL